MQHVGAAGDPSDDLELLDITIPYEVRNQGGSIGPYSIGTITVPFDITSTATEDTEVLGWNSPLTVSTKMEAYSQFVHYGLNVHSIGPCGPSGTAEVDGNDFVIALGCKFKQYESCCTALPNLDGAGKKMTIGNAEQYKGTFMHEIGHNFGFLHGGADEIRFILNTAATASLDVFDPSMAIDLADGNSNGQPDNVKYFEVTPFSNPSSGINCKPDYVNS